MESIKAFGPWSNQIVVFFQLTRGELIEAEVFSINSISRLAVGLDHGCHNVLHGIEVQHSNNHSVYLVHSVISQDAAWVDIGVYKL